jgi:hypothetical protein
MMEQKVGRTRQGTFDSRKTWQVQETSQRQPRSQCALLSAQGQSALAVSQRPRCEQGSVLKVCTSTLDLGR